MKILKTLNNVLFVELANGERKYIGRETADKWANMTSREINKHNALNLHQTEYKTRMASIGTF